MYGVYLLVRRLALEGDGRARAHANAARVVGLERRLGLDVEPRLQRAVLPYRRVVEALNLGYATLNVGATMWWLHRLFRRRDPRYHTYRTAAVTAFLGAQPVFLLYPVAPPRTLDHLVDTLAEVSGVDIDSGLISRLYHPLAAMPSIHVTIAVVTAACVGNTARRRWVRKVAPAYPPVVAAIVLLTANHYVLDAVAGGALGSASLRIARWLEPEP